MPIVFSALTPHPPILIPEIGKDHLSTIPQTCEAYAALEQQFYAAKPESVVIISPHGTILDDSFSINLSASYTATFKQFGDFSLEMKFRSDYMSIQEIRAGDETRTNVPLVLTSQEEIDHGFAVPLYYLLAHLKDLPIIPITYSGLSYEKHLEFGKFLHEQLAKINKRFAVIASGDLSHRLTKDAPAGYSKRGQEFDETLLKLIGEKNTTGMVEMDSELITEASECGLRSLLILLGLLSEVDYAPEVLAYEGPFGVGYATVNFKLS